MNRRRVHLFSLAALLLTVLSTAGYALIAQETKARQNVAGDMWLTEFASYKHWTRVNDVPLPVTFSLKNNAALAGAGPFI